MTVQAQAGKNFQNWERDSRAGKDLNQNLVLKHFKLPLQLLNGSWCSGYHYCTTSFNKA